MKHTMRLTKRYCIGEGSFTKVYRSVEDKNVLFVKSCDPIKEHMASDKFPKHRLFPQFHLVQRGKHFNIYKTRRLKTLTILNPEDVLNKRNYEFYKKLRLMDGIRGITNIKNFLDREFPKKYASEVEAIKEALESFREYGEHSVLWETLRMNLAVHNGKLILLDCLYPIGELEVDSIDEIEEEVGKEI